MAATTSALTPKGGRTRLRIVAAAADLMYDRGVAGTTIEDVLAAADASVSQLYHYFDGKTDLVKAVIAYQNERVVGSQERTLANLDSLEGLRNWGAAVIDNQRQMHCRGGCPIGSLGSELAETDPDARFEIAAGFERWHNALRDGLRAMQAQGRLVPQASPDDLALAMLAVLQGGLLLGQVQRTTRPLEVAVEAMLTLVAAQSADGSSSHPESSTEIEPA
jgi:TetR/AcrR family transcriptional regulator, transcriptional repressor for nem operon